MMVRAMTVCATLMLAALTACGGNSDAAEEQTPDVSPTTSQPSTIYLEPPDGSTVEPKTTDYRLGQEAELDDLTAEVVDYRKDIEPKAVNEPGERQDAVLVRMCNDIVLPEDNPEALFSSYNWQLRDDDDGAYDPSGIGYRQHPKPTFPSERALGLGDCVKGWIVYSVPATSKATEVVFVRDAADVASWPTK